MRKSKVNKKNTIITLILFVLLTVGVMSHNMIIMRMDEIIHRIVYYHGSSMGLSLVYVITRIASPLVDIILIVLIIIYLLIKKDYINSVMVSGVLIMGNIFAIGVKNLIRRNRPTYQLIFNSGYSFPSGHVFDTTILLLIVNKFLVNKIKNKHFRLFVKLFLVVWELLVVYSRIAIGNHYLSDTIGAILLGVFTWNLIQMLIRKLYLDDLLK